MKVSLTKKYNSVNRKLSKMRQDFRFIQPEFQEPQDSAYRPAHPGAHPGVNAGRRAAKASPKAAWGDILHQLKYNMYDL